MKQIRAYFIFPPIHPLLYSLGSLICGIYFQSTWDNFIYLNIFSLVSLICYFFYYKKNFLIPILLAISSLSGAYCYRMQIQQEHNFYAVTALKEYTIYGNVEEIEETTHPCFRKKIFLKIVHASHAEYDMFPEAERFALRDKTIQIYVSNQKMVQIGDTILLHGLRFTPPLNHDYRRYLIKEKSAASLFLNYFNPVLVHRPQTCLYRTIAAHKKRVLTSFCKKHPGLPAYLFSSLFLGNKAKNDKSADILKEQCALWGTSHYLARSGLHLVIFIMVWSWILLCIPLGYNGKQIMLILLSIIYAILSWPSTSFNRALSFFILYKLCIIRSDSPHFLYILTLISCITLINNPILLFFLDFQLSFGITFALLWYNQLKKTKMLLVQEVIS